MLIVHSPQELAAQGAFSLAIGTFDALHLGHQAVLAKLKEAAQATGALAGVLYFEPSPKAVLHPENPPRQILSPQYRHRLLESYGVEAAIEFPFSRELAALPPRAFLERYLLPGSGARITAICVGDDWRFGAGNCGDVETLRELLRGTGIRPVICPQVYEGAEPISSTRIRKELTLGHLPQVRKLLGRPYALHGKVTGGQHLASRRLDCPTANLEAEQLQLPPYGVYAARTILADGTCHPGIIYIGDAPTVRGPDNGHPIAELHLFHFSGDLYGQNITIEPLAFLRESQLFSSLDDLKRQIDTDIRRSQAILLQESN